MPHRGPDRQEVPIARLQALLDSGLTRYEAAQELGVTPRLVKRRIAENGLRSSTRGSHPGHKNPAWRGGRILDKSGYVLVLRPDHPEANRHGYVREHRLVMEQVLGRPLLLTESVHHKQAPKSNNHPSNLEVYDSNADHLRHELKGRIPNWSEVGKLRMKVGRPQAQLQRWPSSVRAPLWQQELDDLLSQGIHPLTKKVGKVARRLSQTQRQD